MTQTEVGRISRLLLKHARDAFRSQDDIDRQWQALGYLEKPDFERAVREYDDFVELLNRLGAEIEFLPLDPEESLDSIYVRDASIPTDGGVLLCSMGKDARRHEPESHARYFESSGLPLLGRIEEPGSVEGGDVAWLSPSILAVGQGYRTNLSGIAQLRGRVVGNGIEVVEVGLPHFRGPSDVFHLMSILSPVADDLAVVYSPLMPVGFRNRLLEHGYRLVEVPEEEFDSLGCNVLATEPGVCVLVDGNPTTARRLADAGAVVHTIRASEICRKGCGGPTCLTRPLQREASSRRS